MDALKEKMIESLSKCKGIISIACRQNGISRQTHYNWCENDPEYKEAFESINEESIDHVECKLHELVDGITMGKEKDGGVEIYERAPDTTAIIFYLKTKGKRRGYVEKQIIETIEGKEVNYDLKKLSANELIELEQIEKRRVELLSKCVTDNKQA